MLCLKRIFLIIGIIYLPILSYAAELPLELQPVKTRTDQVIELVETIKSGLLIAAALKGLHLSYAMYSYFQDSPPPGTPGAKTSGEVSTLRQITLLSTIPSLAILYTAIQDYFQNRELQALKDKVSHLQKIKGVTDQQLQEIKGAPKTTRQLLTGYTSITGAAMAILYYAILAGRPSELNKEELNYLNALPIGLAINVVMGASSWADADRVQKAKGQLNYLNRLPAPAN